MSGPKAIHERINSRTDGNKYFGLSPVSNLEKKTSGTLFDLEADIFHILLHTFFITLCSLSLHIVTHFFPVESSSPAYDHHPEAYEGSL
jgi:hypothetical protein